jgi:hypothetical protein
MPQRTMPVRDDHWKPVDRIYDGILDRSLAEAEDVERRDGTPELMAGAVVLAVLAVVIIVVAKSAAAAILICGILAAGLFWYVVIGARHEKGDRSEALWRFGGPGRLPAGYLVHPSAWRAGLGDHVAHLPESQLKAAARMCHLFPGTVDDLIVFVGNIAIHVPPVHHGVAVDVDQRAKELIRIGLPILQEHAKTAPPLPVPGDGGKGGKKKR